MNVTDQVGDRTYNLRIRVGWRSTIQTIRADTDEIADDCEDDDTDDVNAGDDDYYDGNNDNDGENDDNDDTGGDNNVDDDFEFWLAGIWRREDRAIQWRQN